MRRNGRSDRVDDVAFSSDGELLAAATGAAVRIWRIDDGALTALLSNHGAHAGFTSVAFVGEAITSGGTFARSWPPIVIAYAWPSLAPSL